jgi:hypothetical protein
MLKLEWAAASVSCGFCVGLPCSGTHLSRRQNLADQPILTLTWWMAYAPEVQKLFVARHDDCLAQYDPVSKQVFVNVQTRKQLIEIDPTRDKVVERIDLPGAEENHGLRIERRDAARFTAAAAHLWHVQATNVGVHCTAMSDAMRRLLTLDGVPDSLLAEYGFTRGAASASTSYPCTDSTAALVPLLDVIVPGRKLNKEAVRDLLAVLRDGAALDPVSVFREPGATQATLLSGLHRWHVSKALGFAAIPCTYLSREDAEVGYRYPSLS